MSEFDVLIFNEIIKALLSRNDNYLHPLHRDLVFDRVNALAFVLTKELSEQISTVNQDTARLALSITLGHLSNPVLQVKTDDASGLIKEFIRLAKKVTG